MIKRIGVLAATAVAAATVLSVVGATSANADTPVRVYASQADCEAAGNTGNWGHLWSCEPYPINNIPDWGLFVSNGGW